MNKLKTLFLLLISLSVSFISNAQNDIKFPDNHFWQQVSIGKGDATTTNPNAWLEIGKYGTTKGLILPRTQTALLPNTEGNFAYDINYKTLWYNNGNTWVQLADQQMLDVYDSSYIKGKYIASSGVLRMYRINGDSTDFNISQLLTLSGNSLSISGGNSVNLTTANVTETSNLYFTQSRARSSFIVSNGLTLDNSNGNLKFGGFLTDHTTLSLTPNYNLTITNGSNNLFKISPNGTINFGTYYVRDDVGFNGKVLFVDANGDLKYGTATFNEIDPVFTASPAFGITGTDIINWNAAYNEKINSMSYADGVLTLNQQDGSTLETSLIENPAERIPANWLTAWDYAISADIPNITNPDLKYLIVNGNAGDTTFTVVGGTGTADFTPNYAAAAFDKLGNHYFSFLVIRQSGGVYNTDRPLKYNLVNDTIKFMWSSYQGQHMTDYGYRGYADMIYNYHKNLAAKDKKLHAFYPEDNGTLPFIAINGAVNGGFIPSTSTPQLYGITTATINYSQIATTHFIIQQGGVVNRGGEWTVNLGKKNGYCETWVGINRNLPGFAKVLFYLDGVLKRIDTVRGGVQKLTYNYNNASTGKLQIVTGDVQNTAIRVGRTIWYQTDLDTTDKVYTNGKILFVGDSWTQHYLSGGVFFKSSPERFKARVVADGGNPNDVINVGRGGMTTAWGKYWFKSWLNTYHPKYVYIEFYINDANSSSFVGDNTNTTWNFSSTDPYAAGTDVDGKVTQQQWIDNLKWMKDTAIANGVIPILLMNTPTGSLTQTQGQSGWYSALRPETQYYDIETIFTSSLYADNSVNAPVINAPNANLDTISTKYIKGSSTGTNGLFTLLQTVNSSLNKGWIMRPSTSWAGTLNRYASWENNDGSDRFYWTADGISHAFGFNAFPTSNYGFRIANIFQISYASGIARITGLNSSTIDYLYVGDSMRRTIRMRIPVTFQNYNTSSLPISPFADKGSVAYDSLINHLSVYDGNAWQVLSHEVDLNKRFDSTTAKNRLIQNQFTVAQSNANFWVSGQGRVDANFTTNGIINPYLNTSTGVKEVKNPSGAYYVNQTSPVTGAIVIKMPFAYNNTMMSIKLKFYDNSSRGGEIIIGGYNFSSPAWLNTFCTVIGQNNFNNQVRLGHDGTTNVIIIGDVGTSWSYPKVYVEDMLVSGTGTTAIWGSGWSSSLVTDLSGYTLVTPSTTNNLVRDVANGIAPLDGNSLIPSINLGTGTANSTTALFGDQTYKAVALATGSSGYIQNQNVAAQPTSNYWISGVGTQTGLNLAAGVGALNLKFQTAANLNRWAIDVTGAESTGNAGSNFRLTSYADDGTTIIASPLTITRSNGNIATTGSLGVGVTAVAKLHTLATTEQFRASYDASNYMSLTVGNTGIATFSTAGSSAQFAFNNKVNLGAGFSTGSTNINSNLNVPQPGDASSTTDSKYLITGGTSTIYRVGMSGSNNTVAGSNSSFTNAIIARTTITTAGGGTHPFGSSLLVLAPNITAGAAPVANAATVLIDDAPTGGTNNWALYINSGDVRVGGNLTTTGTITAQGGGFNSLRILKEDITDFTGDALKLIDNLKLYNFKYKNNDKDQYIGMIIDSKNEVPKELLMKDGTAINTYNTLSLLIKSIQQLNQRIDSLEAKIKNN